MVVLAVSAAGQTSVQLLIKDKESNQPVAGATVAYGETKQTADEKGVAALSGLAEGKHTVRVSFPGYEEQSVELNIPFKGPLPVVVLMTINNEVGAVVIRSTRSGREIENEPTRVEAIDEEEIDEKINMRPANVAMILHESTGIQVQQTSAVSATQTLRIQGLDGRYTQVLKDGFPSYGGFSGSLSILEIPPLDLKQVEIIKGPSAIFYGGGAIAGVVNFISKEPEERPVTALIFNQTSAFGTDASIFTSQQLSRVGYTILASANLQKEFDPDDDDFTELPRTRSISLNPRLFFENGNFRFTFGNSFGFQRRIGGDVLALSKHPQTDHTYFEKNRSIRNVTTASFEYEMAAGRKLSIRQAIAYFDRQIETPQYRFGGDQINSFTEATLFYPVKGHGLVFGTSITADRFREASSDLSGPPRNESNATLGFYAQDTFDLSSKLAVELGARVETARRYGTFFLPRVSLLYRWSEHFSTRVGAGAGYKTPTIFTEQAEERLFRNVRPLDSGLKAERSGGGTFDLNYSRTFGEASVSVNQMFFYTHISDPLVLTNVSKSGFAIRNADTPVISRGFETNAKIGYRLLKIFLGYTFTDAKAGYLPGDRSLTLLARNKINSALVLESHQNFKAGIEAYFTGRQTLTDRTRTSSFTEMGIFGEKTFGKFTLFVNAENITDVRQGRYAPVVNPPHDDPTFAEVWTHLEGRIFNGGIKIRF